MDSKSANELNTEERSSLLATLKTRFEKNSKRHKGINWNDVQIKLEKGKTGASCLWSLYQMEETGGEPDVVSFDKTTNEYLFVDCAAESPKGRRSLCYDQEALDARKEAKPADSAVGVARAMGITLLTEQQYRELQQLQPLDAKTSSWIQTPPEIRALGGALFADYRFGKVFVYHNGAQSYYAGRGFRGVLKV